MAANTPRQDAHNRLRTLGVPFKMLCKEYRTSRGTWVQCAIYVPDRNEVEHGS